MRMVFLSASLSSSLSAVCGSGCFIRVSAGMALGLTTLGIGLWVDLVFVRGGRRGRFCGIMRGRDEVILDYGS